MALPFEWPSNNITGFVDFVNYVNHEMTSGFLGIAWLVAIFMVAFLSTSRYSVDRALGFSSFITMVSAIFLRTLGMINNTVLFITVVAMVGSILFLWKSRSEEA